MSLFNELKRRNVIRVALAYGITAWLIAQIAGLAASSFGAPGWVMKMLITFLILGLPVAMIMAWAYELTPEGLRRERDVAEGRSTAHVTANKLNRTIIIVLGLAVVYFAFDKFWLDPRRDAEIRETATRQATEARGPVTADGVPIAELPSIAVLPFADMSPEGDQEYIGDGIAEELLDEMAQLRGINVAARTSSFAFKGSNTDLKSIGEQLGVSNILEGSVRKDKDEIRITAQLIDARTGFHLWSRTYDRPLDDIFFVQDDIARSVAGALSIALDADGREHLSGAGTSNVEAYDFYLQATSLMRRGQPEQARQLFQRAVEIDPEYAEAWVWLGGMTAGQAWLHSQDQVRGFLDEGREMVLKAIEFNPELAMAWDRLAGLNRVYGDWIGAAEANKKAAELAPSSAEFLIFDPLVERGNGLINRAINLTESRTEVWPPGYGTAQVLSEYYIQVGRYDDARETLEISTALNRPNNPSIILRHLFIALSENDTAAIRERLETLAVAEPSSGNVIRAVLANFEYEPSVIITSLRNLLDDGTELTGDGLVLLASLAAYYGDPELALEAISRDLRVSQIRATRMWYPFFSQMRQLPEFKDLVEELGLVAFWRAYEWADFCRPSGENDFECF